jgi:hypothetical protein
MNQCDGCQSGAGLRGGLHIDEGCGFMVCQRGRYVSTPTYDPSLLGSIPEEVWEAERVIGDYFQSNNIDEWAFGRIRSRE